MFGILGDLVSLPIKAVSGVVEAAGALTGTDKLTDVVTKPLDKLSEEIEK